MGDALKRELGDAVEFTQPKGGLFFWARLTGAGGKVKDAGEFAKRAIEQGWRSCRGRRSSPAPGHQFVPPVVRDGRRGEDRGGRDA
jgi:DNA-binding transcriptional MocR family regulator